MHTNITMSNNFVTMSITWCEVIFNSQGWGDIRFFFHSKLLLKCLLCYIISYLINAH